METILIVEDKESMAEMLSETLESEGYRVISATDGAEGIKLLKEDRVDLVLTDLKLPKKDGMEVLHASKEENQLIPVIVMTAFGSIEIAVDAMKGGAFDFITKPFDTDHLLVLIKRALENQRLHTENDLDFPGLSERVIKSVLLQRWCRRLRLQNRRCFYLVKVGQERSCSLGLSIISVSGKSIHLYRLIVQLSPETYSSQSSLDMKRGHIQVQIQKNSANLNLPIKGRSFSMRLVIWTWRYSQNSSGQLKRVR
jgi:DNA-binding response OmpR family regulator